MLENKKIAVVVPAHNEERFLERAVLKIPAFVDIVIIVDDHSNDKTGEIAALLKSRSPRIHVVTHSTNLGVGGAIVTGYRFAIDAGVNVVAVMAGDAQMDPDDLEQVLLPVLRGKADYCKGDRLSWPGVAKTMPLPRFIGNHVFSAITRISSGYLNVKDSQCGYTAVDVRMLKKIDLGELFTRYGFPNDFLAILHRCKARLAQVPVRPLYGEEKSGISIASGLFGIPLVLLRSFIKRVFNEMSNQRWFVTKTRCRVKK